MRGTYDSTRGDSKETQGPPTERIVELQDPPTDYLTVAELSEELGISLRTAYYLIARGDIPHMRVGRSIRVYRDTLEEWRREQEEARKNRIKPQGPREEAS